MLRFILVPFLLIALAGCAKPLPPEHGEYAGEWQSSTMELVITPDGRVAYKRLVGENGSRSISGPIQSFEGDNFIVGVGPIKTRFVVSEPPHEDQGSWKMTVDGVELTRQ